MSNDIKNLNVDGMINQFIDRLVIDADMSKDLEEDVFLQLKKDLKERLESRINAVILSQIPEHKLEEFEKLLDNGESSSMQAFCAENIPNLSEVIAGEFLNFRNKYIA